MKLNLVQMIAFGFMVGWIVSDVAQFSRNESLMLGFFGAFIIAFTNDAHKVFWQSLKKLCKSKL